ncbi:Helix-turn-helix domain protein [Streptococcus parauberis]|uniref:helix-turn-helix domain-containing protein n=1 Tax=Streptococcus parauberis TaxID=1348 RepID=UPI000CCFC3BC|nr:helix-turn-helix transcriptional regulator [Streptococcus parauberis]PNY22380.1 Helix-turn-helix domain protein [Streptococcus parauberis]
MENHLKKLRKEKGLTQDKLAQKIGISRRGYQKWENAEELKIPSNKVEELAKVLEVPTPYLLGIDNLELAKSINIKTQDEADRFNSLVDQEIKEKADKAVYQIKKDRFITFLWKNKFILSDSQVDSVFDLIFNLDLNNPKSQLVFNSLIGDEFLNKQDIVNSLALNGFSNILDYESTILPRYNENEKKYNK